MVGYFDYKRYKPRILRFLLNVCLFNFPNANSQTIGKALNKIHNNYSMETAQIIKALHFFKNQNSYIP